MTILDQIAARAKTLAQPYGAIGADVARLATDLITEIQRLQAVPDSTAQSAALTKCQADLAATVNMNNDQSRILQELRTLLADPTKPLPTMTALPGLATALITELHEKTARLNLVYGVEAKR